MSPEKRGEGPVGTNGVVNLINSYLIIKKKRIGGVLILLLIFNQVD